MRKIIQYFFLLFILSILVGAGISFLVPIKDHLTIDVVIYLLLIIINLFYLIFFNIITLPIKVSAFLNRLGNRAEKADITEEFNEIFDSGLENRLKAELIEGALIKIKSSDSTEKRLGLKHIYHLGENSQNYRKRIFFGLTDCLSKESDDSSRIAIIKVICFFYNHYGLHENPNHILEEN